MNTFKQCRLFLIVIVFSGLFLNSCTKKDTSVTPVNQYLISSELKFGMTTADVKTSLQTYIPDMGLVGSLLQSDIEVQKIVYKTTFKSSSIQASGLVCLPKTAGNYPVLCFQNGTNTLHSEAPTENPKGDVVSMLESVASMGFIVVIPDYIGFGASAQLPHPYLHAESTTQSILDMLRAVNEFGTDVKVVAKPTKNLFVFGYSQGGWATMLLQKAIETNYSSEFHLVASSCAAGPYSIKYMNDYVSSQTDYPMPYFLAYLLNAYTTIGLVSNPLSDFIQAPYAAIIPGLFDGTNSGGSINALLTTKMANFLTPEYITGFATNAKFSGLKSAFIANSVEAWNISTPMRLYHGADDNYIPVSMSQTIFADFKTKGVPDSKIQLVIIPGADHTTAITTVALDTILWFLGLK